MSMTKRLLEDISIEMGLDGEITKEVIEERNSRALMLQDAIRDWDREAEFERNMQWMEKGVNNYGDDGREQ